ncbi:MAG: ankyrin repeat domain-containing protein [Legionellaceae bacterium]|nr:ankyrin repeat domain-containing protein [Legionellaceae bacterium]
MGESKTENPGGMTALHIAAVRGQKAEVSRLLAENPGAANQMNNAGQPPLFNVLELAMRERFGENAAAAKALRREIFWEIWEKTDPELRTGQDEDGQTILHLMAINGFDELIPEVLARLGDDKSLLTKQMQDNFVYHGEYPIHTAILNAQLDVVRVLYALDSDSATYTDADGKTPLHYAAQYGKEEMIRVCGEQHQGEVDVKDDKLRTPLMLTKEYNRTPDKDAVLAYLTSMGANEANVDTRGTTTRMSH